MTKLFPTTTPAFPCSAPATQNFIFHHTGGKTHRFIFKGTAKQTRPTDRDIFIFPGFSDPSLFPSFAAMDRSVSSGNSLPFTSTGRIFVFISVGKPRISVLNVSMPVNVTIQIFASQISRPPRSYAVRLCCLSRPFFRLRGLSSRIPSRPEPTPKPLGFLLHFSLAGGGLTLAPYAHTRACVFSCLPSAVEHGPASVPRDVFLWQRCPGNQKLVATELELFPISRR